MGYWLRGHEDERNNCFSKIQLVGQKYRDKTTLASKTRFSRHCFGFQSRRFSLQVGYNIQPSSSSTNQNAALIIDHLLDFTKCNYTMLSKYGNCTRLLKIKKQDQNWLFLQIRSGRILDILWVFLIKLLFHSRLFDMR